MKKEKSNTRVSSNHQNKTTKITSLSYRWLLGFFLLLTCLMVFIYSNHFDNGFHYDDYHVIVKNPNIHSLWNISTFFTDATTVSSRLLNQTYRPLLTTSLAIDYWLAGGANVFWFHITTFFWYVFQCILMYFIFLKIANISVKSSWTPFFSLFAITWYGLLTVNAETINYITARSDSLSTFWAIVSFFLYIQLPQYRKWGLYLIPFIIACLFKQTAVVFPFILFFYVLYFEQQNSLNALFHWKKSKSSLLSALKSTTPAWILAIGMTFLLFYMMPETYDPAGPPSYYYWITQPSVIFHYVVMFFLPLKLTISPGWQPLTSIISLPFIYGVLFLIFVLLIAFITAKKRATRPISFGILWFLIALLPTSLVSLNEILNYHRVFWANAGLVLAAAYCLFFILLKEKDKRFILPKVIFIILAILIANAYGTYQRNKVWDNELSIWRDAVNKYPSNSRSLTNYGIALLEAGDYSTAARYLKKALLLNPISSPATMHYAITLEKMGQPDKAKAYYLKSIKLSKKYKLNDDYFITSFFYSRFLLRNNQIDEAKIWLKNSIKDNPVFLDPHFILMKIYHIEKNWQQFEKQANEVLKRAPGNKTALLNLKWAKSKTPLAEATEEIIKKYPTANNYIVLSNLYYLKENYIKSTATLQKAISLFPKNSKLYYKLCNLYFNINQYKLAEMACQKALSINSHYLDAKNLINSIFFKNFEFNFCIKPSVSPPSESINQDHP